jgi:hypothetical protein
MYLSWEGHRKTFRKFLEEISKDVSGREQVQEPLEADEADLNRSNTFEVIPMPLTLV